ncbi:MAG: type II toxin-antitoxin system VapC family toxin [Desulfovibrio sp.]|nr:type II toxin-antitoxin system VapC family toxin [Desulfovibrio sp.]
MSVLLDTNICIYLMKHNPPGVQKRFSQYQAGDIGISSVSVAELEYGVKQSAVPERNARVLEAFLLPLEIVPFDTMAAQAYGVIRADLERRGQIIGSLDMLIAAVAISRKCLLVTHNLREFSRVEDLACETWV